jgi:hypothetical protein
MKEMRSSALSVGVFISTCATRDGRRPFFGDDEMVELENLNPNEVFGEHGDWKARVGHMERSARILIHDASTAKGRDAIANEAAKISRSETYLDQLAKDFASDLKKNADKVESKRREMHIRMGDLWSDVHRPLMDFEASTRANSVRSTIRLRRSSADRSQAYRFEMRRMRDESFRLGRRHGAETRKRYR